VCVTAAERLPSLMVTAETALLPDEPATVPEPEAVTEVVTRFSSPKVSPALAYSPVVKSAMPQPSHSQPGASASPFVGTKVKPMFSVIRLPEGFTPSRTVPLSIVTWAWIAAAEVQKARRVEDLKCGMLL